MPSIPTTEVVDGHRLRCYDLGPKVSDRYTVVNIDAPRQEVETYSAWCLSRDPFSPLGLRAAGIAQMGKHLGHRVRFDQLPAPVRSFVARELGITSRPTSRKGRSANT